MITSFIQKVKKYGLQHKIVSGIVIIVILGGGYYLYSRTFTGSTETRYILGTVAKGTIISSISGSGQITASRQIDIKPQVSGKIIYAPVVASQKVKAGTLIAEIDPANAEKALRDAQVNLDSANLSLQKLQEATDPLTLAQTENALSQAKNDLQKAYDTSFSTILSTFVDLPSIMTGLQDILYGSELTHGQDNLSSYASLVKSYDDGAQVSDYRTETANEFASALAVYNQTFADYKNTNQNSGTTTIQALAQETYTTTKTVAAAVKSTSDLISFVKSRLTEHNGTIPSLLATHQASLSTYTSETNSDVTSLYNIINTVATAGQTITEKTLALSKLKSGTDPLDIASAKLTIQQRQNALLDAQNTLADYYVRAPFDGTIAKVNQNVADYASSGTAIASLITSGQVAELSLNEVDAAKVKIGNKATLSFDAIDGLSLTGTVSEIDVVGTVSQGVVSYTVKINLDTQDDRVKPGMTVNASIMTQTKTDALLVPSSAVKTTGGASFVQVFNPPLQLSGTAGGQGETSATAPQSVQVETGISDDTNVEIVSGLSEGSQIVTRTVTGTAASQSSTAPRTTTSTQRSSFGGGGAIRL